MNKYVQAPISRIPSGDLQSSGMSFMQGGAALTGGALGSDPKTWAPRSGAVRTRKASGRPAMRGKGSCGGAACKSCGCMGRGLYA